MNLSQFRSAVSAEIGLDNNASTEQGTIDDAVKPCATCGEEKIASEFYAPEYRRHSSRCKVCQRKAALAYYYRNKDKCRAAQRERRYGISEEVYQEMRSRQRGRCAICARKRNLYIDHGYATGKVRELLCPACNTGLGHLQEDTSTLRAAIRYLERHES